MSRFSSTDIRANSRRPSGTSAMPWRHTRCGATAPRSSPAKRNSPERARCSPAIVLTSVLLPAPFGPMTETTSPASTSSVASHTAGASPYAMASWRTSSNMGLAEIDLDDARGAHRLARTAGGDDLALVQHHHAVRQLEDGAHEVLDEENGHPTLADLADQVDRARDLAGVEARQHLVEQDHARPARERARQLEEFALVQVELVGQRRRAPAESGELQPGARLGAGLGGRAARRAERRGQGHVVERAEVRERARDLIGARHAEPGDLVRRASGQRRSAQLDPSAIRRVMA